MNTTEIKDSRYLSCIMTFHDKKKLGAGGGGGAVVYKIRQSVIYWRLSRSDLAKGTRFGGRCCCGEVFELKMNGTTKSAPWRELALLLEVLNGSSFNIPSYFFWLILTL